MMTPQEVMTGLAAILGSGGASAAIVAFFGYLSEARKGRIPPDPPMPVAIAAECGGARNAEILAGHLASLTYSLARGVAVLEIDVESRLGDADFHDRIERRLWTHLMREAGGHGMRPPP